MRIFPFYAVFSTILVWTAWTNEIQESQDSCQLRNIHRKNPVIVLKLNGSMSDMGRTYGEVLSEELRYSLDVLTSFFQGIGANYEILLKAANQFHERYTEEWDQFVHGMAYGSGLTYDDCKILNAMETIQVPESDVRNESQSSSGLDFGCAFIYVPGTRTSTRRPLIARNYDYPPPFNTIAKNLILTIIHQEGKVPTAIIGLPGQIYCGTCLNSHGLFLELNNGAPSGGTGIDKKAIPSMLVKMLDIARTSAQYAGLVEKLGDTRSDYSLIVSTAWENDGRSFEYCTDNSTVNSFQFGDRGDIFVSTNFFLNPVWGLPPPTDKTTFVGVTRRENLMEKLGQREQLSVREVKNIMDIDLMQDGAKWDHTIYQIVYDYESKVISLRSPGVSDEWIDIDLNGLLF